MPPRGFLESLTVKKLLARAGVEGYPQIINKLSTGYPQRPYSWKRPQEGGIGAFWSELSTIMLPLIIITLIRIIIRKRDRKSEPFTFLVFALHFMNQAHKGVGYSNFFTRMDSR